MDNSAMTRKEIVHSLAKRYAAIEYGEGHDQPWEPFITHADEAVSIVMEQAARVAEGIHNHNALGLAPLGTQMVAALRQLGKDGG